MGICEVMVVLIRLALWDWKGTGFLGPGCTLGKIEGFVRINVTLVVCSNIDEQQVSMPLQ